MDSRLAGLRKGGQFDVDDVDVWTCKVFIGVRKQHVFPYPAEKNMDLYCEELLSVGIE